MPRFGLKSLRARVPRAPRFDIVVEDKAVAAHSAIRAGGLPALARHAAPTGAKRTANGFQTLRKRMKRRKSAE